MKLTSKEKISVLNFQRTNDIQPCAVYSEIFLAKLQEVANHFHLENIRISATETPKQSFLSGKFSIDNINVYFALDFRERSANLADMTISYTFNTATFDPPILEKLEAKHEEISHYLIASIYNVTTIPLTRIATRMGKDNVQHVCTGTQPVLVNFRA